MTIIEKKTIFYASKLLNYDINVILKYINKYSMKDISNLTLSDFYMGDTHTNKTLSRLHYLNRSLKIEKLLNKRT